MEGWKTKVGGGLLIATGVLGFGATLLGFQGLTMEAALTSIGLGFAALGIGHKFDKIKAVLAQAKQ